MSREEKDFTYKPIKQIHQTGRERERQSRRTTKRVNYREIEILSSGPESDGESESGFGSIKLEPSVEPLEVESIPKVHNKEIVMAREGEESNVSKLLEMMMTMRMEDRQRDKEREERRVEREEKREEEREAREARLLETLRATQPAVPQKVTINSNRLPVMKQGDNIETFLPQLRGALVSLNIPEEDWKGHIYSQVTTEAKDNVMHLLADDTATYDAVEQGLLGIADMSFANAAEAIFSPMTYERTKQSSRTIVKQVTRWVEKLIQNETYKEAAEKVAIAYVRSKMIQDYKTFMDLTEADSNPKYSMKMDEWERAHPEIKQRFKIDNPSSSRREQVYQMERKKGVTCFHCQKVGHISRECRTRLAAGKESTPALAQATPASAQATPPNHTQPSMRKTDRNPIICYNCQEQGHKAPQCPKRVTSVKRVQIPINRVKLLKENEVMGKVQGHLLPITVDTGAEITVVPEECVGESELTGESFTVNTFNNTKVVGKKCNVQVQVGDRVFPRTAVTQPGEAISWTALLSFKLSNHQERDYLGKQLELKETLAEEDIQYMPPRVEQGELQPAVVVSQGTVVEADEGTPLLSTIEPEPHSEEETADIGHADGKMVNREVEREKSLVPELEKSLVEVEAESAQKGGSADSGLEEELSIDNISSKEPRTRLAEATKSDDSLLTARSLADSQSEGYHWIDGLVFRTRRNSLGDNIEQLCLPKGYCTKCLKLAHEHFGHTGRNKMGDHIRKYFYWPSITADSMSHIKSCTTCQKKDKTIPRQAIMQEREIVTVPSERVAIDIVGPFPVAKGGFRYLLTYLDMATRWPEAIPLRKTTTRIVIDQLTLIFSRCGFPTTLVSDNGPQFVATAFQKWLKEKGITHVWASPYHPQGNGVVERMHRTLKNVITRCTESKGNWASIVPMALYFVRCMPNRATGLSPFKIKHGWEPTTPLQLLYKGWVQQDLGPIDLEDWTLLNAEKIQHMREVSVVNLKANSEARKKSWDRKAQDRQFEKGDQVYLRK